MTGETNQCVICEHVDNSRIDILDHIMTEHTLQERQNALINRCYVEQKEQ